MIQSHWFLSSASFVFLHIFFCVIVNCVYSFNLDAEFSTFYNCPQKNAYFGYSVDYSTDLEEAWIVVGAPKASRYGEIYKCKYNSSSTMNVCEVVFISKEKSPFGVKNRQMLGASLAVIADKELLSCDPQYIHVITSDEGLSYYTMIGICYFSEDFTMKNPVTYRYLPCRHSLGAKHTGDFHSLCQAGFSTAVTKNKKEMLVGAVGSFYNQGSIMLIEKLKQNLTTLPLTTAEFKVTVPSDKKDWTKPDYYRYTYDINYMGYSVVTGISKTGQQLLVTSAPRRFGYNIVGAVSVYNEKLTEVLAYFNGEQIGEGFGIGLAIVDVNGDNLDDVIVGSPFYTDETYKLPEVGRIYVYYQIDGSDQQLEFSNATIITGNASFSRLGNTITSVGDINNDNYQDILVSAPYERSNTDNSDGAQYGAVHLFNGGKDGLHKTPSQIIHGANLEKSAYFKKGKKIRGLGYSTRGGKDVDGNGYPDVVLGAYLSDQAVVIRARPVVKLQVESKINPNQVNLEDLTCNLPPDSKSACFQVDSCFSYSGKNLPASIEISYKYDVDSSKKEDDKRAYVLDSSVINMTLVAGKKHCVNETVYIKKDIKDKLSNIAVTILYWLREMNQPVEPVLDMLSQTSSISEAEIYKNCGPDGICIPDLKVESVINPSIAIVGSYTEVLMSSVITNSKENAYQTVLIVNYPEYVVYAGIHESGDSGLTINCINFNQSVTCDVANPLKNNAKVIIKLKFGIHDLKGDISQLIFESLANCTNEQVYVSPTVRTLVNIQVQANINIFNVSLPEIIQLDKLSDEAKNETRSVSHTYEITNTGPSTLSSAEISLLWPLQLKSGELLFALEEVVTDGQVHCDYKLVVDKSEELSEILSSGNEVGSDFSHPSCSSEYYTCYEIKCTVGEMQPKTDVLLILKGKLLLAPILDNTKDSIITSNLVFEITKFPYQIQHDKKTITTSEVNTYALYRPTASTSVSWWIVVVSIAAGVLFLLIIILILWKCGFFKRKTPPTEEDADQQKKLYQEDMETQDE